MRRPFVLTARYHRSFSHRSYRLGIRGWEVDPT